MSKSVSAVCRGEWWEAVWHEVRILAFVLGVFAGVVFVLVRVAAGLWT